MSAPAQSNKLLRRAYVIALSLIAICSIASFAFLHASIDSMSNDAETLNISGKQRSLSQHAAHLIEDAHLAPSRAERQFSIDELEKVVREFAAVHKALIVGDAALGLAGKPSPAIRKMLFEPPVSADKLVSIFLGRVETVMEDLRAGRSEPRAARVLSELARVDITGAYNDIVAQYQREASDRVWRSKVIHFSILLITLALLAAEARFIFLPAVRSIETQTRRIQLSKAELDHAATHDALTGIANRRHALDTLQSSIDDVGEKGGNVAVLHLDLDGFKAVNDTLGHVAGDEALIQMAGRLCSAVREADTVARVGGDEFIVICPGAGDECDPEPIAERIMEAFSKPFSLLNDINVDLECTIGISLYPNDAENVNDLLIASDLALYRAKQAGKNQFLLFDRSMREEFQNKVELARRVKSALELGEFEMFYQPQIEMRTGRVLGIEALLRWRDPERGLRMPTEFIEVIEHSDGAQQLGTFVLDRAISDAAEWHRQGINFGRLGVNITAAQLRDTNFIDHFLSRLLTHGLPPEKTAVEILESTVLSSQNRRLRALFDELNDLDISVEFDDFGTGYASLMHLRQLPVNRVKIDREFVLDLPNNDNHENIVHGVINFVTKLGLELVAEGVETVEQAQLLSSWGCECAQGYLFARPAAVEDVTAYLKLADYKRSLEHVAKAQAGGTEDLVIPMAAGAGADPS